jgi:hypothetical protein
MSAQKLGRGYNLNISFTGKVINPYRSQLGSAAL